MKKITALLLALIMIFTLCACGGKDDTKDTEGTTESAVSSDGLSTAFDDWAKGMEDVETLTVALSAETPEGNYSANGKVNIKDGTMLITAPVDTDKYTIAFEGNKIYSMQESEGGLPRGQIMELTEEQLGELYGSFAPEDFTIHITEEQISHILDMLTGKEPFDLEYLEEIGITPNVDALLQEAGITKELVENVAESVIEVITDEEWQKENFNVTYETKENVTTFSVELDPMNIVVDIMAAVIRTMGQPVTAEELLESLEGEMGISDLSVKIDGTVTDGIPTEITATLAASEQEYKFGFSISDINNTDVDIADVKDKLSAAHGDYTECQVCGSEELYFQGYCESCASVKCCVNYCGNDAGEDGYCDDCRIPCAGGCGNHADHEEGYCFDCYYDVYCYNDCGNKATNMTEYDGYCDDCYNPCKECSEQAAERYDGYCYNCYYERYCYNDCGNEATHFNDSDRGYCDDCYVKCADCDNHAEYDGTYCYSCYTEKYCYYECGNEGTHDMGYYTVCDECYEEHEQNEPSDFNI